MYQEHRHNEMGGRCGMGRICYDYKFRNSLNTLMKNGILCQRGNILQHTMITIVPNRIPSTLVVGFLAESHALWRDFCTKSLGFSAVDFYVERYL